MSRLSRWAVGLRGAATRLRRGSVVLLYHRVTDDGPDTYRLNVSPRNFAEQLAVLRENADILPLDSLLERPHAHHGAVAITFDDGYADNLHTARPLLERVAAPATVFVTTGSPGTEFWWDSLERILMGTDPLPGELTLEIGGRRIHWNLDELRTRQSHWLRRRIRITEPRAVAAVLLHRLQLLLRELEPAERTDVLARLESWARPPAGGQAHRCMTPDELVALANGGLIGIGAHTVTHPLLSALPPVRQAAEIRESRDWLRTVLNRDVRGFAYPYGQRGEYSVDSVQAAREAGFVFACAAHPGFIAAVPDRYKLPRMWVDDWTGDEFARRLLGWLPRR